MEDKRYTRCPDNLVQNVIDGKIFPNQTGIVRLALDLRAARKKIAELEKNLEIKNERKN